MASLDWHTGEPNAKYHVVRMLATQLGARSKALHSTSVETTGSTDASALYALAMTVDNARLVLIVSKVDAGVTVRVAGAAGRLATVLAGVGLEPGFAPPQVRRLDDNGSLGLGPFAVALVQM